MPKAGIWIAALIALIGSAYYIGRTDCTNSFNKKALDGMSGIFEQQAQIEQENLIILDELITKDAHQTMVHEAIKSEREKTKNNPAIHITRGDVRLLNASRSNKRPDTISPALTVSERGAASTVTEQTLITADIECAEKYNTCNKNRNALIDIVNNYKKKTNDIICK